MSLHHLNFLRFKISIISAEHTTGPIDLDAFNVDASTLRQPHVEALEISEDHQSAYPEIHLSNSMLFSFYSLQPQNNLPIIGSHGNSLFGYHLTFGHYPLTPISPPHSTQIPPSASNFQPSASLPTTRVFALLVTSAIFRTDPSALSHMDSFPPINATLPSFAIRQE